MTDIRWENLRNLAGLTLDQIEARQLHNTQHHTGDKP